MTARIATGLLYLAVLIGCLGLAGLTVRALTRDPDRVSLPTPDCQTGADRSITVRDATHLIVTHLVRRRDACAVRPPAGSTIDLGGDAERRLRYSRLVPCLSAVDELPCTVAGRWSGDVNPSESDAPNQCRAMFGQSARSP